jgi:hypothetical protein
VVKTQDDQDRLIDDTLALFQDAIADSRTVLPAEQDRRAAEPKDIPPSAASPREEAAPSLIGHALSLVKKVVISEHKAVMVKKVVISEQDPVQTPSPASQPPVAKPAREKPIDDTRSDPLLEQALSMVAMFSIDEPGAEAVGRQPDSKADSEDVLPLERWPQEQPPSLIDQARSAVGDAAPTAMKAADTLPSPWQTPMKQLSPKERLDMERADIRKRIAIFREHQQRFQRERDEFYAATIAKVRTIARIAET